MSQLVTQTTTYGLDTDKFSVSTHSTNGSLQIMAGDPHDALHAPTPIVDFKADKSSTFHGAIIGNLTGTASKATADAQGRNIVNTYALKTDLTNVDKKFANYAPKANPTFTGTVTIPTPATSDNSTKAASTAFVKAQGYATGATLTESLKKYLPLAGGTVTGNLGINGNLIHNVPTGTLSIFTSTDGSTGSKILLNGHDVVGDDNGGIKLVGQGTYGSHTLMIGKNGLQADGKQLVRAVDGVNADANGNVNLNGKYLPIGGGTITGALTVNGNSVVGGRNVVRSVNGVTAGSDGNVSIKMGGGDYYVTSVWHSGSNGYRRWNDGYIEQWGYMVSPSGGQNVTVTLHQRLSSPNSAVVFTSVLSTNYTTEQWKSPTFGSSGLNSTNLTLYTDGSSWIRGKYWYVYGY